VVVASIKLLAKKMRVVWVSPLRADAGDGGHSRLLMGLAVTMH
jgi:hypothetical protein